MKNKDILKKWKDEGYLASVSNHIDSICSNRADIEGADLSGIKIGSDAFIESLKSKSLYQARVVNSDFSYSKISGSVSNAFFCDVNLSHSVMDRCVMVESNFVGCDFTHVKLVAKLNDSVFERVNFSSSKISGGTLGLEYGGRRVKFIDCDFTGAVFNRVEFRASRFVNCIFSGTKFVNCDFRGVKTEGGVMPAASQFEKMDIPDWADRF